MIRLQINSEAECSYSYMVAEERVVTDEDFSSILQVYQYALVKPERIAFLDAVYLRVINQRYRTCDNVFIQCYTKCIAEIGLIK